MYKYNSSGQTDRQTEEAKERQCGRAEPRTVLDHANPQSRGLAAAQELTNCAAEPETN